MPGAPTFGDARPLDASRKLDAQMQEVIERVRPLLGKPRDSELGIGSLVRSPVVVAVLEREDAVVTYRGVMGATDPAKAEPATIRKLYGANVGENAVHGSDSLENAQIEIAYFVPASEVSPKA